MNNKQSKRASGKALHDLFKTVFSLRDTLAEVVDRVHQQAGMKTSQLKVMAPLIHKGPLTVPDIAARLGVSRQFVQTVYNALTAEHLIKTVDNPRHKRSKLYMVTEKGAAVYEQTRLNEHRIIEGILPDLNPVAVADAANLLEEIRSAVIKAEQDSNQLT